MLERRQEGKVQIFEDMFSMDSMLQMVVTNAPKGLDTITDIIERDIQCSVCHHITFTGDNYRTNHDMTINFCIGFSESISAPSCTYRPFVVAV